MCVYVVSTEYQLIVLANMSTNTWLTYRPSVRWILTGYWPSIDQYMYVGQCSVNTYGQKICDLLKFWWSSWVNGCQVMVLSNLRCLYGERQPITSSLTFMFSRKIKYLYNPALNYYLKAVKLNTSIDLFWLAHHYHKIIFSY